MYGSLCSNQCPLAVIKEKIKIVSKEFLLHILQNRFVG